MGQAASERLALEVVLDDRASGIVSELRRDNGRIFAERDLLARLGFNLPAGSDSWIALDSIAGLSAEVDAAQQRLVLRRSGDALPRTQLNLGSRSHQRAQMLASGASLDYDLNSERVDGNHDTALRLTPRVFGAFGTATFDGLWQDGVDRGWRRFDSFVEHDFPERLEQLRLGDAITLTPDWGRAVRFGGFHWSSDFSLRPDLITFPLPSFSGQAAVPSTVDLFVDGLRTQSGAVPAGPFSIPQLPVITGGGDALIVLRDAVGREQTYNLPFYVSPSLLREGLSQYSIDLGRLRDGFGGNDDHYSDSVASVTERYGVSDTLTLEGHAEGSASLRNAGAGVSGRLGNAGEWEVAAARSDGADCEGDFASVSTSLQRGPFSAHVLMQQTRGFYCDLASIGGLAPPRRTRQLVLGWASGAGQFNASLLSRTNAGDRQQIGSLSWSQPIGRHIYLTLGALFTRSSGQPRDTIAQASLLIPLDSSGRTSLSVNATSGPSGNGVARLEQSTPAGVGYGAYVQSYLDHRDVSAGFVDRTAWTELSVDVANQYGGTATRVGAQGAFAWLDGGFFASRLLGDAFAVVDTGAVDGIMVFRDNQPIGRSDASGRVLVEQLVPFAPNRISIDPRSLPEDVTAPATEIEVLPYRGGGVISTLGLRRTATRSWRLLRDDGRVVPVGSVLTIDGNSVQTVGHDGNVYLDAPGDHSIIDVRGTFGTCHVRAWPDASTTGAGVVHCVSTP